MRATFTSGAVCGTETVARIPNSCAAKAWARPAFPPEATTIPASPISPVSSAASCRLKAPRGFDDGGPSVGHENAAPTATVTRMGYRTRQLLRGLSGISLLVSVGSIIAATNWHSIWRSTALVGAQQSPPTTGLVAVEAQATFQQWVIVALIGLVLPLASCVFPDARASR